MTTAFSRIEGDDAVRHALQHRVGVVLHAPDVVEQLGVLERDGDLRRERLQPLLVLVREDAAALVQHLRDADHLVVLVDDRHAEDRPREEPGLLVEGGIEPEVGIGIGDVHALAGREDRTGNAEMAGEADFADLAARGHAREQGSGGGVVKEDGRPLGVEHPGRFLHDPDEDCRQIEFGADLRDQFEEGGLLDPDLLDLLDILVALKGDRRLARHFGEQLEIVPRERPIPLVETLHDADRLAGERPHRHADHALRAIAGALVDARIEALVRIGIGRDDRLARIEGVAGEARAVENADLVGKVALRNPRIEFGGARIVEKERSAIAVELAGGHFHEFVQKSVEGLLEGAAAGNFEQDQCALVRLLLRARRLLPAARQRYRRKCFGHDAVSSLARNALIWSSRMARSRANVRSRSDASLPR